MRTSSKTEVCIDAHNREISTNGGLNLCSEEMSRTSNTVYVCLCEWEFAICLFHENTHHVANRKEPLNNTIFSIGIEHVTYNRQTFQKKEKKANKSFPRNIPDCIKLMNFRCISKITNSIKYIRNVRLSF